MAGRDTPPCPHYGRGCLSEVLPAILDCLADRDGAPGPAWVPEALVGARQIVLLVLDGLGAEQLAPRQALAPALGSLAGGTITSVAPTTTATALTSIVTGRTPAEHGLLGYRLVAGGEILNVLRWSTAAGDARRTIPPGSLQVHPAFRGASAPMISRAEFAGTGFTAAQAPGARLIGWKLASSIPIEVAAALSAGEAFVYVYYDGIDKAAHAYGLDRHYDAELVAADRLVADLLEVLPSGAALVVTADHGLVEVPGEPIVLDPELAAAVGAISGEARFCWLHARAGAAAALASGCVEAYGEVAWVMTREALIEGGYFGGPLEARLAERLGEVALIARDPVAFGDPGDPGATRLVARHGSLTSAELSVPFVAGVR